MTTRINRTVTLSTHLIRPTEKDGTQHPVRVCAVGFMACDLAVPGFVIEAFAVDPAAPGEETADALARWLLERSGGRAMLVGWALDDREVAGLIDIADKLEPEQARVFMDRILEWVDLGVTDLSPPDDLPLDFRAAAAELDVSYARLTGQMIGEMIGEGREADLPARLMDAVATQAALQWMLWAQGPGGRPDLCAGARQALADWRASNAAN